MSFRDDCRRCKARRAIAQNTAAVELIGPCAAHHPDGECGWQWNHDEGRFWCISRAGHPGCHTIAQPTKETQ